MQTTTEVGTERSAAVIHVDLDGARDIYRHHGWDYSYDDDPIFETGMRRLLDFLRQNELKATLFAIASDLDVKEKRRLLEQAVADGHEIASHSLTHPEFYSLTSDQKRREVGKSRERLETVLDTPVRGFRTPNYQIDRETVSIISENGYSYDSSVFPGPRFAKRLKVRSIPQRPHYALGRAEGLVEMPLPDYRPAPFPFHPSYSLLLGSRYFRWGLRQFREKNSPLILLFHLTDFSNPLPSSRLTSLASRFYTISQRSAEEKAEACQGIVEQVRTHFRFVETQELLTQTAVARPATGLVLGISTTHETGAALYDGADCLAAVSEERMDRIKFSTKYPPKQAIDAVVETAGVDPSRITDVVVAGMPPLRLSRRMFVNQLQDTFEFHGWNDYFPHFNKALYRVFALARAVRYGRVARYLRRRYDVRARLHFVPHHLCHAASVYRTAPFDDALIVTADGVGDDLSMTISRGKAGDIEVLHEVPYPHSFGQFYTACTQLLGFRANRHEGKITGLSGFGKATPELYEAVKSTIRRSGRNFRLDKRYYSEGILHGLSLRKAMRGEDLFDALQYRNYKEPLKKLVANHPREDVAAVFQRLFEEELAAVVEPFAKQTGARNLCLSGGVFANVKANAALFETLGFDQVYIFPAMGDGGLGAGAALELMGSAPKPFNNVYWGPEFSPDQMREALAAAQDSGLRFTEEENIERTVAALVADRKVVARFNGRMEFGPRALGNRSILYSAEEREANTTLNRRLGRTEFMPFAPIAMEEHASKLFRSFEGREHACRFMTITVDCTDWTKERCPAIVHVDGTARPQFVSRDSNESMYEILRNYEELTGVPLMVNTSFNMHEEPIVCTPEDAVRAFLDARLDFLAMGPFLARLEPVG